MRRLLLGLSLCLSLTGWAQDTIQPDTLVIPEINFWEELTQTDEFSGGTLQLSGDRWIPQILKEETDARKEECIFSGFRIQILSVTAYSANIDTLRRHTEKFSEHFPEHPAYLQYFDTDFKIRAGNFRSRIEAIPALQKIRKRYPGSYIVKTDINLRELQPERDIVEDPEEDAEADILPVTGG